MLERVNSVCWEACGEALIREIFAGNSTQPNCTLHRQRKSDKTATSSRIGFQLFRDTKMSLKPILRPTNPPSFLASSSTTYICTQCRHARLIRRPKRPYTFTQLITLSDGSAYTIRTTSPLPVYRSTRDTRNSPLWNPSSKALANVESDEAGRLAAFRARFGRSYDAVRQSDEDSTLAQNNMEENVEESSSRPVEPREADQLGYDDSDYDEEDENLLDLISGFGQNEAVTKDGTPMAKKEKKK